MPVQIDFIVTKYGLSGTVVAFPNRQFHAANTTNSKMKCNVDKHNKTVVFEKDPLAV